MSLIIWRKSTKTLEVMKTTIQKRKDSQKKLPRTPIQVMPAPSGTHAQLCVLLPFPAFIITLFFLNATKVGERNTFKFG